jgi:hypothetical protein
LTSADSVRIKAMIENGRSDSEIAMAFNVSRPTILRLRHALQDEGTSPVRLSPLQQMIAAHAAERGWRH